MDGEKRMGSNIGNVLIVGVLIGERMGHSKY